ncbi:MAG: type II toxin-antitoxin system RelE/ParE family toxin [Cryomorphaceae bacterium]
MKIEILVSFADKLDQQVEYIAQDKPQAARKFRKDVIAKIKTLKQNPFKCKKSLYSENENVRDLIFKGYTITFRVNEAKGLISVFALRKYEEKN